MKTIKTIIVLSLVFLMIPVTFGQSKEEKKQHTQKTKKRPSREKVKAMKIGYITDKLSLTAEEAQKFWPVYNEFEDKMDDIRKKRKEAYKKSKESGELTDVEIEKRVDSHIFMEQKELDIKKEYHAKFKTVLPIKKVAKLYKANENFKRDLLKKIRDHKGGDKREHRSPPPSGRH